MNTKKVCRFNTRDGAVLEVAPDKITGVSDGMLTLYGEFHHCIGHTADEARAIWADAKPKPLTVAPEYRRSLLDAAWAIDCAFEWLDSKEGFEHWGAIYTRLTEPGRGEPI